MPAVFPPLGRRREGEGVPMAEEVLVGRGDIDERRERMAELEAQVCLEAVCGK